MSEIGEADFMEALEAVGGCSHMAEGEPQRLDTICSECRKTIAKLVLLRDHYRRDKDFFKRPPKAGEHA